MTDEDEVELIARLIRKGATWKLPEWPSALSSLRRQMYRQEGSYVWWNSSGCFMSGSAAICPGSRNMSIDRKCAGGGAESGPDAVSESWILRESWSGKRLASERLASEDTKTQQKTEIVEFASFQAALQNVVNLNFPEKFVGSGDFGKIGESLRLAEWCHGKRSGVFH